ncbi:MAG: pitrilysin family protein [Gemmatimonadota bacterium]|nr:pitrilysin family protein [Gemmatimonadota bacterium]MDE2954385.1 pitrilysin family protein [Gemmatimonadota bacterium]
MKKIYAFILFIVCVLPASTCPAYQLIGTEVMSKELTAQHYTINPNLDAVIVVDRTIPTFEYHTYYSAGSADEEEGKQGRIHFLEHIMAGAGSYAQVVSENGGQQSAATAYHFVYFFMRFPKDKLDLAVEIDSERYYNTVINEEVVEKEKKIVLTERSRKLASLTSRFVYYFSALIYGKKNFISLGTEDFIKQLEPVGLRAYHENFLRRQKRLIVIIGDIDVDYVLTKLDEAYGNEQTPGALPSPEISKPKVLGKKFRITSKGLSIAKFRKSWYTPSLGHRDYAAMLILARILNKSSNSLRSYIVDSGLAKIFSTGLNHYKGFSLMTCAADLPHSTSSDAVQAIIRVELERIKSISEDEVNAICNELLQSMYSAFYNRLSMAHSFGQAFAHTNDPMLYPKLIRDIESVHTEDIRRIIDQYMKDDNSITFSWRLKQDTKTSK